MEIFAFVSTDVVPAVFTRTSCIMNLISLPSPACLLWMALVIYRGEPKAISHVCVCVDVGECVCLGVAGAGLVKLLSVCMCLH